MITDVGKQLFDILDMANGTVKAADICAMVRCETIKWVCVCSIIIFISLKPGLYFLLIS